MRPKGLFAPVSPCPHLLVDVHPADVNVSNGVAALFRPPLDLDVFASNEFGKSPNAKLKARLAITRPAHVYEPNFAAWNTLHCVCVQSPLSVYGLGHLACPPRNGLVAGHSKTRRV